MEVLKEVLNFIIENIWGIAVIVFLLTQKGKVGNILAALADLIRGTKIKREISVGASTSQPRDEGSKKQLVEDLCNRVHNKEIFTEQEEILKKYLDEEGLGGEHEGAAKLLIKHLAVHQILLNFEKVYNEIFESQIILLRKINQAQGMFTEDEMLSYLESVKASVSEQENATKENYFFFLYDRHLIIKQGEDMVNITVRGKEFLLWMIEAQKFERKGL